ncbi:hypothetical protein PDIG_91350 [Penicillium digitatum PHI26]|uniref:Subtelomeric hrmA-associated cluster protein AFUB-079030/YDR124W-like helical bundle domain-containing protein n=2 Tax=Penicillium digitatum TaxID=36651 RepID=K9FMN9_PEND2|nr:hypothetical protein PDIP_87410 [Penicillium digitatum Pd1]EKV04048.1 hypothetical protein PDIG_91350 [Penicillium digitatum PHI26]EKV04404.1 hypothetical protein PDIP_87410 [Penicillium digitatum Pd1]
MVSNNLNNTTCAMKRAFSDLQEPQELNGDAQLEMSISSPSYTPRYRYYAMIFIDDEGNLQVQESQSVQDRGPNRTYRSVKCLKSSHLLESPSSRHFAEHDSDHEDFDNSASMVSLRIGDTSKVTAYYERAYREFQQLNCRAIAKEFIRAIEPLKQVKHPYNGKTPVGSASGTERNPEATKPNWWPPGVMHKEPDHLKKEYRLQLLVHITCKLGSHGITIDMLKQVARGIERKLPDPQRAEVIYEILRVRNMQEKFEKGQVGK